MDRKNIEKIGENAEDRLLLAKLWDKIQGGMGKNIPASTGFLSPREQVLARFLFGDQEGLCFFGGATDTERRILAFLPEYLDESWLSSEDGPLVCIRATFFPGDSPNHRDFLGALIGAGVAPETIGDIFVGKGSADFFVLAEVAPYLLQNFTRAGRTVLHLAQIPLDQAVLPEPEIQKIQDTLASLRLDNVISAGFRMSRSKALDAIRAGKAAVDGLPRDKPDLLVPEGAKVSLRGFGRIRLAEIGSRTKKDRISVVIHRYL